MRTRTTPCTEAYPKKLVLVIASLIPGSMSSQHYGLVALNLPPLCGIGIPGGGLGALVFEIFVRVAP